MSNFTEDDDVDDFPAVEDALLQFSEDVRKAIDQVIPSNDPLDAPDFNAVDYINAMFPTEQSLSNIDQVIQSMEGTVRDIDTDIRNTVRQQTNVGKEGQTALLEAQNMIAQLFTQVRDIKDKAENSEAMVREITRDIKQLDCAKRNLTTAITTLNHLHMLVSGVDSLKELIKNRQYGEIVMPLQGITEVINHFTNYRNIPQIDELAKEVNEIQVKLAEQITTDFKGTFSGSARNIPHGQLSKACLVLTYLDPKVRKELLDWFVQIQLSEYVHLFHETEDVAWIDKLDRRYAWFKKHLLGMEDKYGAVFPAEWDLSELITVEFCAITRNELSKIMTKRKNEIDVKLLLFAIQRTKGFEALLGRRFTGRTIAPRDSDKIVAKTEEGGEIAGEEGKAVKDEEKVAGECPFDGIIGQCFYPYLYIYINSVDRNLFDLMERFVTDTKGDLDREDATFETTPAAVLSTCADLFIFYKKSLVQCKDLSNDSPMLSLTNIFQKYLREYADRILQNNLPKVGGNSGGGYSSSNASALSASIGAGVSSIKKEFAKDLRDFNPTGLIRDFAFRTQQQQQDGGRYTPQETCRVCRILSTGEYCLDTTQQLEEKLKEKIADHLRDKVNLSQEQDVFHNVISNCIQLLVQDLEIACEPSLIAMSKMQWQNIETVGDQSAYVNAIIGHFKAVVPLIRTKLSTSRKYFTQFCIKFANLFIPKFIQNLYKCKPLSTVGAEQLLLDAHSLKTTLLDLPSIGSQVNRKPPSSYTKVVVKGMTKAEMILKVAMAPTEPEASFVDQFLKLLPESDAYEFQKILEMKGLKTAEKNHLISLFHPYKPSSFVSGTHATSPKHDTSSIRKLNNLIKKRNLG